MKAFRLGRSSGNSGGGRFRPPPQGHANLRELAIPEIEGEAEPEAAELDDGIDAEAERLVKASEFESLILDSEPEAFDGARLVETLTRPYIADAGGGIVALDPNALRKLFSTTQTMLTRMAADVAAQTEGLEADAPAMEDEYRQGLGKHAHRLEAVVADLAAVDRRFRDVADKAVRIGDRLSKLEAQRVRAAEATDVLEYFKAFETLPTPVDAGSAGGGDGGEMWRDLPDIFSDDERRAAAAAALARMKAIAYEMDLSAPVMDRAVRNMQAYSDFVERELLELFERAAGRSPPEVEFMRECAEILYVLNEGEHLQSRYVFFVVSQRLQRIDGATAATAGGVGAVAGGGGGGFNSGSRNRSGSINGLVGTSGAGGSANSAAANQRLSMGHGGFGNSIGAGGGGGGGGGSSGGGGGFNEAAAFGSLSGLFGRVIVVCQSEFGIIMRAFPAPLVPKVTKLLLQRILNDPVYGIQARVEAVLSPAPPGEPLPLPDYLNCLCTVEQQTMALFDLLKHQELQLVGAGEDGEGGGGGNGSDDGGEGAANGDAGSTAGSQDPLDGGDDGGGTSGDGGGGAGGEDEEDGEGGGGGGGGGGKLGQSQAHALRVYLDDQAKHLFFEHRNGYAAKETRYLMQCLLEHLEAVWEGALLYQVTGPATLASLESFPVVQEERIGSYLSLLSGPLRPGLAATVLGLHAEAVRRCRTILQTDEEREQRVAQHFQVVCRFLADHIVVPALRAAAHLLPTPTSNAAAAAIKEMKGEGTLPPRVFYEIVKGAGLLSARLQTHYKDVVAPGMASAPTLRTIANETRNAFTQRVAMASAKAAQRALELVVAYAERQLAGRSYKNDYCPREDGSAPIEATKSTRALCSVLKEQHSVATECLRDMDLTPVWTAVGLKVHRLFVDHIRKVRVNVTGAFVLTSDVNLLTEVLGSFGCPKVDASLELLREIVKLLLVPPENLPSLMETGRLAALPRAELREFCKCRTDFWSHPGINKAQWAKDLFPVEDEKAERAAAPSSGGGMGAMVGIAGGMGMDGSGGDAADRIRASVSVMKEKLRR